MARSLEEVLHLYQELKNANLQRNLDYFRLHNIYHGNYYDYLRPDIHDGAGRLILRDNRRSMDARRPLVANLMKGIVDDYVSVVGQIPDIKVPVFGPEFQDFADRVQKYHYGVWHHSHMVMQMKAMAWWNSVMGTSIPILWPNFKRRHAEIRMIAPYMFYGVPDMSDPYRLSCAFIAEKFDYLAVKEQYRHIRNLPIILSDLDEKYYSYASRDRRVEVIKFLDKDEVRTIIGREEVGEPRGTSINRRFRGTEIDRVDHPLGRVPAFPIQNIYIPGEMRGHSDIEQAIGLNEHINFLMNSYEEYVLQDIYSPIVIEDPQKAPDDIFPMSPNEVIPVNAGGKVYRLMPGNGSAIVDREVARAQSFIEHNTGDPQVRTQGRLQSSITTGRAVEKTQGPVFGRMEYRHDIISFYMEMVNSDSVHMTQEMFANDEIELFGANKNSMFAIKMLGRDLEGYEWNKVMYGPTQHMGLNERATFVLQLLGGEYPLIDDRTAIELLNYTDYPGEMLKRIEDMIQRHVQRQAALAAAAQGGGPGGGMRSPIAPQEQQASLASGGTQRTMLPPGITGAAGGGPPEAGVEGAPTQAAASPRPDMSAPPEIPAAASSGLDSQTTESERISHVLESLQNRLKGDVYVTQSSIDKGDRIEVIAENFADAKRVRKALTRVYKDKVEVRTSKKIPDDAVFVAGPKEESRGEAQARPSPA